MSLPTSAKKVYSSYGNYFEPRELLQTIGYTKPQKFVVCTVSDKLTDEPEMEYPPKDWVARIAIACIEVIHGKRSVNQMRKICTNRVSQDLLIKQSVLSKRKQWSQARIVKVKFANGVKESAEVSINFEYESKIYPMAMNLSLTKDGWRINACEIGPH